MTRYRDFRENFTKSRYIIPSPWRNEERIRAAKLLSVFGTLREQRILEIGCSTGYFSGILAQNNRVWALDIEDNRRYFARTGIRFVQHDADTDLPFSDGFFDVVIASETLEHIRNIDLVILEISRVLKNGGVLICDVPTSMLNLVAETLGLLYPIYKIITGFFIDRDRIDKTAVEEKGIEGNLGFLKIPLLIENWFNISYYGRRHHLHKHSYLWWSEKLRTSSSPKHPWAQGFCFLSFHFSLRLFSRNCSLWRNW